MDNAIEFVDVDILFGREGATNPRGQVAKALELLDAGQGRAEILAQTGVVAGIAGLGGSIFGGSIVGGSNFGASNRGKGALATMAAALGAGTGASGGGSSTAVTSLAASGLLSSGFTLPSAALAVLTDHEIFSRYRRRRRRLRRTGGLSMAELSTLKPGDFVVHEDHGVGVYKGMKRLTLGGQETDCLELSYAERDVLYVPVHQLSMVSRYAAGDGARPGLHRLGSAQWQKTKARAKKAMGGDMWPYGLEANRPTLEALVTYLHDQGLIKAPIPIEDLFVPVHG